MSKRPSLAETMRQAAAPTAEPLPVRSPIAPSLAEAAEPAAIPERRFYAATRVGKKKVTAALTPADHKRLRLLALEHETTTEALLSEAIGDLFKKYDNAEMGQG